MINEISPTDLLYVESKKKKMHAEDRLVVARGRG